MEKKEEEVAENVFITVNGDYTGKGDIAEEGRTKETKESSQREHNQGERKGTESEEEEGASAVEVGRLGEL